MADNRPYKHYEPKWQQAWEDEGTYHAKDGAPSDRDQKFYGLVEFPYPSGDGLHVGHPRSYTAIDVVTRKHRMEGKNVLFPMGWDAFGLPTENYAIKHKIKPADATAKNVGNFTRQLKSIGFGFDWSREVSTADPAYYKWTQWMFLKYFKSTVDAKTGRASILSNDAPLPGLAEEDGVRMAYKARTTINWCPNCKIGLANEEAIGGVCERCGQPVEKRVKAQWMIRITKYADRLLSDLDTVDYLDKIKAQQVNWIGKSEGAHVDFKLSTDDVLRVFTTRPDTLFGATYLVLAPEHPLVEQWSHDGRLANANEVNTYREATANKPEIERLAEGREKTGVVLEGITATNPATGASIPVWIADYVLAGYGTGAIMAVPGHDERDLAFALKFNLPHPQVVFPGRAGEAESVRICLSTMGVVVPLLEKNGVEVWVEGGLALAFQNGMAYRAANDIDLVTKDESHLRAAADVLQADGWTVDDTPEKVIANKQGMAKVELIHPKGMAFADRTLTAADLESEYRELWGVKARTISVEYQQAMKRWQAEHRDKITDKIDLQWIGKQCFADEGIAVNSGPLDRLSTADAKQKMITWLEEQKCGERAITFRLRDWVFSRQRYWGEPIPIIICKTCGYVPVPEDQLPVILPDVDSYEPTDTGESPLSKIRSWVEVQCPSCGADAERETDTMPNWAGSSWYFLRYCDPHNDNAFADPEKLKFWMPVDLYNGGMEHTTLHLLYSRFWHKFLWDIGAIPNEVGPEPYTARRSHGLILAEGGEKMSKSKGNVINPDDIVGQYGADVFRMYELFMGPFDQPVPWDVNGIEGVRRFLDKSWRMLQSTADVMVSAELETAYHQAIKKVGADIISLSFNTAVSQLMILTNAFSDAGGVPMSFRDGYLQLLAPFAPHMAEEVWRNTGHDGSIHLSGWPAYDASKIVAATFELVIQVNGKVRDRITVAMDISEVDAKAKALSSENVKKFLGDSAPSKVIYVKGRLVTVVV